MCYHSDVQYTHTHIKRTRIKTIVFSASAMSFTFFPFLWFYSFASFSDFDLTFCFGMLLLCVSIRWFWLVIARYHAVLSSNFLGTFVLLWRRGSSVLTAGHLKITRDDRFKIVDDYNLQISNVRTQDAGDYICQIGDQETRDQVHTVEILGKVNSYDE